MIEMNNQTVKIAIPETGGMAQETLEWLENLGIDWDIDLSPPPKGYEWPWKTGFDYRWPRNAIKLMREAKKRESEEEVINRLVEGWERYEDYAVTVKYDLRSGWRIAFSAKEAVIGGVPALIYGSDYPTISGIREGLADAAIIGLDDLFAAMVPYMARGKRPVRWDKLNAAIRPNSTDVRVIGSTGLRDYAGLCLLATSNGENARQILEDTIEGSLPVYVKGRNQGLAYYLLGQKVDARPTESIEEAIRFDKCLGLDVVRTGRTAAEKELYVMPPLLFTFSVIAVDIAKYEGRQATKSAINSLKPVLEPNQDYIQCRKDWEAAVTKTLGKLWVGK